MAPLQIVGRYQADVLSTLLDPNTLNELVHAESMLGDEAYSLSAFFQDLENSIWQEVSSYQPIDQYRRMLQRYYVERLIRLKNSPAADKGYNDITPIVASQLKKLRSIIRASLKKIDHPMTQTHLQYLYDEIDAVLPPEKKSNEN